MAFDNLAATAPFPDFTARESLQFTKKLGNHRGNPRIFFETEDIQRFGFVPGAKYSMALMSHHHLLLAVDPKNGTRAVCKKVKPTVNTKVVVSGDKATIIKSFGQRVLSVIDINSQVLEGFRDDVEVLVTVSNNLISIEKLPKE